MDEIEFDSTPPPRSARWGPWKIQASSESPSRSLKLLFLHGFASSPREMRQLGQTLARDGYECLAPLLPGHGESVYGMNTCDTEDWLDAVRWSYEALHKDGSPVALIGHCLGATLALATARELNPKAIIGMSTPLKAFEAGFFKELNGKPKEGGPAVPLLSTRRFVNDCQRPLAKVWRRKSCHPYVTSNFLENFLESICLANESVPHLRCPLVMVVAGKSQVALAEETQAVLEKHELTNTQVMTAPQAGHALCVDFGRVKLAGEIRHFLNTLDLDPPL